MSEKGDCSTRSDVSKREEALAEYMKLASKKKRQSSASTSSASSANLDPLCGQILINVGRMEFDVARAKGILDKSFPTLCYYMADRGGTSINMISLPGGVPWTLHTYLKLSSIKYPSRLRLYCVRKFKTMEDSPEADSTSEKASSSSDGEGTSHETKPVGFFEVMFAAPKKSKYRTQVSFRSMAQQDYLYWCDIEDERTQYVWGIVDKNPDAYLLFEDNPLDEGCYLESITFASKNYKFIKSLDLESGEACYFHHSSDEEFDVFYGCYTANNIALLCCVAINGYHSESAYSWEKNEAPLLQHQTPLLYCCTDGRYVCSVFCDRFTIRCKFVVRELAGGGLSVKSLKKKTEVEGPITVDPPPPRANRSKCSETTDAGGSETSKSSCLETTDAGGRETLVEANKGGSMTDAEIGSIKNSCDDTETVHYLDVIGSGAFGQVFKAIWRGTIVAAKVILLSSGGKKIVANEIKALQSLHHPNILPFIACIEESGKVVLLTNFVKGKNLYELLHASKVSLPEHKKCTMCVQLAQAVVYMHSFTPPAVHLDIKPENVLVEDETLHVYLADFGLGKTCGVLNAGRTTMKAGTPAFQPPEQLRGEVVGVGSDVYALACIMVEMFGGRPIWEGMAPHTIILKVAGGAFPDTSHLPLNVASIVNQCFVPVEKRISATAFLKAICGLL